MTKRVKDGCRTFRAASAALVVSASLCRTGWAGRMRDHVVSQGSCRFRVGSITSGTFVALFTARCAGGCRAADQFVVMPERAAVRITAGVSSAPGTLVIVIFRLGTGCIGLNVRSPPTVPELCDRTVFSRAAYGAGTMLGSRAGTGCVLVGHPIAIGMRCHGNARSARSRRTIRFCAVIALAALRGAGWLYIDGIGGRVVVIPDRHRYCLCRGQIVLCTGHGNRHKARTMLYRVHESRCGINRRDRRITRYIRNIADGGSAIHTGYGCRDACCLFDVHREQIARYGYCLFRLIDLPNDCLGLSRPVCPPAIISGSECSCTVRKQATENKR